MTKKPKIQSSQVVHKEYFSLQEDLLERSDGRTHPYTSLKLPCDATIILAQDAEKRWIC